MLLVALAVAAEPEAVPLVGPEPPPPILQAARMTTATGAIGMGAGLGLVIASAMIPQVCRDVCSSYNPALGVGLIALGAGIPTFMAGVGLHAVAEHRARRLEVVPLVAPGAAGVVLTVRL